MREVRITLAAGLVSLAIIAGFALARSPMSVAHTNGVSSTTQTGIAIASRSATYCQAREALPKGTAAIRVSLVASIGPRVKLTASSGGRTVASGEQGPGWTGEVLTVPVDPLPRPVSGATVCVSFHLRDGTLYLLGKATSGAIAAREGTTPLSGRMRIEYLRAGSRSWASLVPSIVRHMGLGHPGLGAWIVLLAFALIAAAAALASKLVLKDMP